MLKISGLVLRIWDLGLRIWGMLSPTLPLKKAWKSISAPLEIAVVLVGSHVGCHVNLGKPYTAKPVKEIGAFCFGTFATKAR